MTTHITGGSFRFFLQQEFFQRQRRNPRYSLRAFARDLELSPSTLSEILNGRHRPQAATIGKICQRLSLAPAEEEYWTWVNQQELTPGQVLRIQCDPQQLPFVHEMLHALGQCLAVANSGAGNQVVLELFQRRLPAVTSGDELVGAVAEDQFECDE